MYVKIVNCHCNIFTEKVRDRWHHLMSSYSRGTKRLKEWSTAPSGSAAKKSRKPLKYKYADEMAFLQNTLTSAPTTDNIQLDDDNASISTNVQVE